MIANPDFSQALTECEKCGMKGVVESMISREALRHRKRRILWNNDGEDLLLPANWNSPGAEWLRGEYSGCGDMPDRLETVDDFIGQRMKGKLEGTQVDAIFYCGYVCAPNWEFPAENTRAIGPDPLKHVVDYAHENGMEFFYSFRMNDQHPMLHRGRWTWSDFRMRNLHLLQGKIRREWFDKKFVPWLRGEVEEHPLSQAIEVGKAALFPHHENPQPRDFRAWAVFDFGLKEVRDYYLRLVQEVCRRYNPEGIEFDWGRAPPFFKTQHRANAPVMADFFRQARRLLDQWGQKRGKPVLLATRVPNSPEESLNLGLDAGQWLREGSVDLLIAGFGAKPFSFPIGEWTRLGHEYGVPVFGCIENGLPGQSKKEIIRATAHRYWDAGADGVYLFNHFYDDNRNYGQPGHPALLLPEDTLHDIGDPNRLRKLDKTYWVDMFGEDAALPARLSTECGRSTSVITLEVSAEPAEASGVTLQAQWATDVDIARVSLSVNGVPLADGKPFVMRDESYNEVPWVKSGEDGQEPVATGDGNDNQGWYAYPVSSLRRGVNTLEAAAEPSDVGPDKLLLKQVRVALHYEPA